MTVKLQLLGPPSLLIAGRPARLHSTKTLILLAYLAMESQTAHSRTKLAGLLWGDSQEERARQSLRQALYSLRRVLGGLPADCLLVEKETVFFQPGPGFQVDVLEFLSLASTHSRRLESLRQTAVLYKGQLLEGIELPDSPAFEEWLFFRRDGLEQQALTVFQELVAALVRQGGYQEALTLAQRWVRLDPLHEEAHRQLMQIHAALGDPAGIRRHYRLCTDILARDLGVEPSSETQALYQQLIALKPTPLPPTLSPLAQPIDRLAALPFVGRQAELAILHARLEQAISGRGGLMLMVGEAGMGKTRLITEFINQRHTMSAAGVRPIRWLTGYCYRPEVRAPYTMWADALQPLATTDWQPLLADLPVIWQQQLARLTPNWASPTPDSEGVTPAESHLRLLQGVVQCLSCLTTGATPLLLVFEDIHWADENSLELLHYVLRHLANSALLVIGTYRPESVANNSHLSRLLSELSHTSGSPSLRLGALEPPMVDDLLAPLKAEIPADLPVRLHRHSEGNPLVLLETLRTLLESGELNLEPVGSGTGGKPPALPIPRQVQELIRLRLAALNEEQRRVLNSAAVIGRPCSLQLLRQISGLPELQLLDEIEHLLACSFLAERNDAMPQGLLVFQHNYYRQVIYEDMRTMQHQLLHRRVAEALLTRHKIHPETIIEEAAYHFEQAGDPQAVTCLAQAAQQAEALFALDHAVALYSRALVCQQRYLDIDLNGRFDLLLAREAVLSRQGRRAEQADDVTNLLKLAESLGDPERQALACLRQVELFAFTGQHPEARRVGEQALVIYRQAGNKKGEAQTLRELGFLHWTTSDYGAALAYNRDALQLHRQLGDIEGEATALHNLAEIYRGLGSPRQALAHYELALNLYWARQERRRQGLTLYGMAHTLRQVSQRDEALVRYQQALAHCQAVGDRLMSSRVQHALAGLYWEMGVLEQAVVYMQQALTISREIGYGSGIAHGLIALSYLGGQQGNLALAHQYLKEAITWLELIEDQPGVAEAQARLAILETTSLGPPALPVTLGWVKDNVVLAEGKIYCEFESPTARTNR